MADRSECSPRLWKQRGAKALKQLHRALQWTRRVAFFGHGLTRTDLDEGAGRSSGYLATVFRGKERLSCVRLFALLNYAEQDPADFFDLAFPLWEPQAMIGFLLACKEPVSRPSLLAIRGELLAWGKALEVDDDGDDFLADPEHLLAVLAQDPRQAEKLACAWVKVGMEMRPEVLSPESAERLCRVLVPLGHMMRLHGDRNTAADVLDLAFRIEARLHRKSARAFIYRMSAFLLSDLGYPDFAVIFAARACELCRQADDRSGLGRSTYIQAAMLQRSGRLESAIAHFHLAIDLLPKSAPNFLASIHIASAWTQLQFGRPDRARWELEKARDSLPELKGMAYVSFLALNALAASQENRASEADRLFAEAERIVLGVGNSLDIAIFELVHLLHLVRFERWSDVAAKAEKLPSLSASLVGNPLGEAALLAVASNAKAGQGKLSEQVVEESLEILRRHSAATL